MNQESVSSIEFRLEKAFQRVRPSRTFVDTVRGHLQNPRPQVVVEHLPHRRRTVLMAFGGVLSVSLLILTLARVIFYLLGRSKQAA